MTQAVLFDNDGVLVDTEPLFFETTRAAFATLGLVLTKNVWSTSYLSEGKSSLQIALSLGADPAQAAKAMEARNRAYDDVLKNPPPLRPHVRTTLEFLHSRVKLAIVTGCGRDQFDLVHASSGILHFFDLIVTSDDCSCYKPHPEPYLQAIRALRVKPEDCIAVEDSPRGLASATAAGIPCVVVRTELTSALPFPGALAVVDDLSDVLKYPKVRV